MYSLSPQFIDSLAFTHDQLATLRALGEFQGRQQLYVRQRPDTLDALRTVSMIESTDSSNRLEGITAPARRLEGLMKRSIEPGDRSEQEIAGYRNALELIHQSWADMPVTIGVVQQLHSMLYRYQSAKGGAWKATDNRIVERDADGKIIRTRFTPISAVATPQAMEDLLAAYALHVDQEREPLVIVPLAVLDFLCIHPFTDGNGRVGRLVTLLLLCRAGHEVGQYISLDRIIEESNELYYETLETSSQRWHESKHDARPWLEYFWGVLLRAYKKFEDRVGNIDTGRGAKSERVRRAIERKVIPFQASDISKECPDVSRETIRAVLQAMREEGLLKLTGRGRGAKWRRVE